jgi:hypothetical protein
MLLHRYFFVVGLILVALGVSGRLLFAADGGVFFFHGFLLGIGLASFGLWALLLDEEEAVLAVKLLSFSLITGAVAQLIVQPGMLLLAPVLCALAVGMIGVAIGVRQQLDLSRDCLSADTFRKETFS